MFSYFIKNSEKLNVDYINPYSFSAQKEEMECKALKKLNIDI